MELPRGNQFQPQIMTLDQIIRAHFISVHKEMDGNGTKMAKVLGISRAKVYRKMKEYDLQVRPYEGIK